MDAADQGAVSRAGLKTPGTAVYRKSTRKAWLSQLEQCGARMKAEALFAQLAVLQELRPKRRRP
ncbi:MAG TPA: hypothetical protein VGD79_12355 [Thermoanaerobaculia bacterium]